MSSLINLDSISIQRGAKTLFEHLRLGVSVNDKLGIIGPNGSGKSTLLKIIAGELEADSGRVIRNGSPTIAYVPQIDEVFGGETVLECALRKTASGQSDAVSLSKSLSQAGFTDFGKQASELSGGWKKRLSLAAALSLKPDLLLLDEPTNHLDLAGLHWLESVLLSSHFAWALVSHDRFFLDRTVNRIVEVSPLYPSGTFESSGGYFDFKRQREIYLEQEAKRTSALANKARRELEWASRSPKARTGKAAYRMREAKRLASELKEAKSRQPGKQVITSFQSGERGTRELVQCIKCSFSYDSHPVVQGFSYTLRNNSCLGLLGANGEGKSTLLKIIGGELLVSSGKVKQVAGLRVVYFDQLRDSIKQAKTLGQLIGDGHQSILYRDKSVHIIGWAKRFGFEPEDLEKPIEALSGGEQARALLSVLVRQEADLLLLDEPTNDLDIAMLEALETMILEFEGAVVLVTHDRYMLDEVCTHFLGFLGNREIHEFSSFEQWQEARRLERHGPEAEEKEVGEKRTEEKRPNPPKKLSYKDQLEYGRIESEIQKAEEAVTHIEAKIADPAVMANPAKSLEISKELELAQQEVERLYARWDELDKLRAEIENRKKSGG